jgi:hypothetical protein
MRRIAVCAGAAALLIAPAAAIGAISSNTVAPVATLAGDGERVTATVLLGCDRLQRARLRITVTQRGRDALAESRRTVRCTTEPGRFAVRAHASRRLVPGEATACVLALTRDDARQWCKQVTLSKPASETR